jgi:hypothetical protein
MAASFLRLIATALPLAAGPALAQTYDSVYTTLELGQCLQQPVDPEDPAGGAVWWCEGHGGMPVRVAEGDLRFFVSYGANAATEIAAGETLPQFNRIHTTLEWRLATNLADGSRYPIATILRYFTQTGPGPEGQVLVVTKLGGPGQICHIGYVDALLNADANVLARQVAQAGAAAFVCGQHQPAYYGVAPQ